MAYRELTVTEIKEVLRIWLGGKGFRAVAAICGVDRRTAQRYIETAERFGLQRCDPPSRADRRLLTDELIGQVAQALLPGRDSTPGQMRAHCIAHREQLLAWVEQDIKTPKIGVLLHRQTGVRVPERTLRRFVAEDLGRSRKPGPTVRVADGEPGKELQVDFTDLAWVIDPDTGKKRKLQALVFTPNVSRYCFVWPCWDQSSETIIEALEAAWAFYGGMFEVLIPDNCKGIVAEADALKPRFARGFLEYMQTRDFFADPARVRTPQDKGRVESDVSYVQTSMWAGETFTTLVAAREIALQWCLHTAGLRRHGTTFCKPAEDFAAREQPHLLPAPTEPYDIAVWGTAKVGRDQMLIVQKVLYSMPSALVGKTLEYRADRSTIKAYQGAVLVKVHVRGTLGKPQVDPADYPEEKLAYALRDTQILLRQAQAHGDSVAQMAQRLLDSPLPWSRVRHVYRLLGQCKSWGGAAVNGACRQLLALDLVDVTRVERIVARGLHDRPTPQPSPPAMGRVVPLRFARAPEEFAVRKQSNQGDSHDDG